MILPEGVEISFEFGGAGGGGRSSSKKWKSRLRNQKCQVLSSHNVIGQGVSPAFGDELKLFQMGTVKSIEDMQLPIDERSSLSSITTHRELTGGKIQETVREEVLNESSLADVEVEEGSDWSRGVKLPSMPHDGSRSIKY